MRVRINIVYKILGIVLIILSLEAKGAIHQQSPVIKGWKIVPTSLVKQGEPSLQRIEISIVCNSQIENCVLKVLKGEELINEIELGVLKVDTNNVTVELPEPQDTIQSKWILFSDSQIIAEKEMLWEPPRHWTLYVIKSSHVDIGLHDSQYKQRYYADNFIDQAISLIDSTNNWPDASRFRYVVEGLWWWLNYPVDRSEKQANEVVNKYVKTGRLGLGASHSGNHTQVFGNEELCRSTYYAQELRDRWNLGANAALMVDNNGITWPLVDAYESAGLKYLGFFPNAWNPGAIIDSLGWEINDSRINYGINSGVGSYIDVGWGSDLPHLFYWKGADPKNKILVWTSPMYFGAGKDFGFADSTLTEAEKRMRRQLKLLESKYIYDIWLFPYYWDNEQPKIDYSNFIKNWNERWRWPELRTVGDLSEPFCEVEKRFSVNIPTLSGVITGGWAQHPLSTPTLLADKLEADHLLPTAEKMATLAFLVDSTYIYPKLEFEKAWNALVCNDEHGYGTSYYKGRPMYDTWMQKKDWIDKASSIAWKECNRAVNTIVDHIETDYPAIVIFNPTLQQRSETVEIELPEKLSKIGIVENEDGSQANLVVCGNKLKFLAQNIPSFGYKVFKLEKGTREDTTAAVLVQKPPTIENKYYRVRFSKNGGISGIYDKELDKELIDSSAKYKANQFIYTQDTNESFSSPGNASFRVSRNSLEQVVVVNLEDTFSGASIQQIIILPEFEKRIDIDNKLDHVSDLANDDRWKRFGYYAFPFKVPNGEFRVSLNGCDADAFGDQTGHGTNTYHVARDWAYVGNGQYGVALLQQDNYLIEFGDIHKDKKALIEKPSKTHFFPYIFNDWLYKHAYVTGPSYINLQYRFTIYSHKGEFKKGKIPQLAERNVSPLITKTIESTKYAKSIDLSKSFLSTNSDDIRLLTLKLSDVPGNGIIARFHNTKGDKDNIVTLNVGWDNSQKLTECNLTEQNEKTVMNNSINFSPFGYSTLRIESGEKKLSSPHVAVSQTTDKSITLNWLPISGALGYNVFKGEYSGFVPDQYHLIEQVIDTSFIDDWLDSGEKNYYVVSAYGKYNQRGLFSNELTAHTDSGRYSPPAKVGIFETGLISTPRTWRGDDDTILYLQWGQNKEKDIACYELFRSEKKNFELTYENLVAKIEPGPYVTVPFEDTGLKPYSKYYYRVRAVNKKGYRGEPSELFQGTTSEIKDH